MAIREPGTATEVPDMDFGGHSDSLETDEDFARQMQAKMDAEEARRGCAHPHDLPFFSRTRYSAGRNVRILSIATESYIPCEVLEVAAFSQRAAHISSCKTGFEPAHFRNRKQ